jgi:L-fuculose-phosphate aldolase
VPSAGAETPLAAEREQVAAAARELSRQGLVLGTSGNLSARHGELVAVTPTGAALAELGAERVSVVDLQGGLVHGELEPTSELGLHLGVYGRFDTGAVVHTHSPVATALSCVLDEVPAVHYTMLALGGAVRVAPYATFGTPELAAHVLEALEGKTAALMANHGALVHAADMSTAVELAQLLEWACTVYWRAAALGTPRTLDDKELGAVLGAVLERGYGSVRAAAPGGAPG